MFFNGTSTIRIVLLRYFVVAMSLFFACLHIDTNCVITMQHALVLVGLSKKASYRLYSWTIHSVQM